MGASREGRNLTQRDTESAAVRGGGGTRANGRATSEQVIVSAERLFAERDVEAVSLREVAKAAAGFTEGLLKAAVGLMLAPAGPDSSDPRRPWPESGGA